MPKPQLVYGKDGIYRSPRPSFSLPDDPNFSMIPFLFRNLSSIAHLPALVDVETTQTLTFSDLKSQVFSLANALRHNLNISKNDVVLIVSPNSIVFPIAFFAVVAVGAVVTTSNPQNTPTEIGKQVKDAKPKLIITIHQCYDKVKHFNLPCVMLNTPETKCNSSTSPVYYYSDLIRSSSGTLEDAAAAALPCVAQTDAAAIMYTSGTTGTSKGAVLTHRNFMASALMMVSDQDAYGGPRNVFLCFLPMFHIYGLSALLFAQLQRGNTVVAMARYEIHKMLRAVENYKVTHLYVVPPVAVELAKKQELVKKYDVSSLREMLSGAAPLGKDIMVELAQIFPQTLFHQAYGMTEAGGVISLENVWTSSPSHLGSTGTLAPEVEARIVDLATMEPLPPLKKGEIWIRGPMIMKGYLNNDKATKESIDEEGWLRTGDLGYFDDEGRLYVVDRIKEVIKCKGFQVVPLELEELLLTHPQVTDAAVIGIPDAEAGEVPIAYVVRASLSSTPAEEIKEFVAKRVAAFKRLRSVIFADAIPKSPSGKILKRELRQSLLSKL